MYKLLNVLLVRFDLFGEITSKVKPRKYRFSSLIPDLDNLMSDSQRNPVLKQCFHKVFTKKNVAMESNFVRFQETR